VTLNPKLPTIDSEVFNVTAASEEKRLTSFRIYAACRQVRFGLYSFVHLSQQTP
jgi:hypothetical protein